MTMRGEKETSLIEHLISILQLPFLVVVVIPFLLHFNLKKHEIIILQSIESTNLNVIGIPIFFFGLSLIYASIKLFIKIGNGTLAPWNPTRNMVIHGVYKYVRNPMLIGVNLVLLSEALFLNSANILYFMIFFLLSNHLYFILKEEPDLEKRFGEEYLEYKKNVPRWIPRFTPWLPK